MVHSLILGYHLNILTHLITAYWILFIYFFFSREVVVKDRLLGDNQRVFYLLFLLFTYPLRNSCKPGLYYLFPCISLCYISLHFILI